MSTIDERKNYLLNHPEIALIPPLISNVSVNNNIVEAYVFNTDSVEFMYTTSQYNSKFQSLTMNDDGVNGDQISGDGVYSVSLPITTDVKFYIRAQNNDAMMLSPEKAEYEFYEYSSILANLNSPVSELKRLIKVVDALGREVYEIKNIPLFYIYDDGSVERKLILK